jgi:CDP-paratose 2-epimerase
MGEILVTGGCGFIGSNLMDRLLTRGQHAVAFDNMSRPGAERNAEWLRAKFGSRFRLIRGDVRDPYAVKEVVKKASVIYHLAGQVALTVSFLQPALDFESNALGTLNILEAARTSRWDPVLIYPSTNRVYGRMDNVEVVEKPSRYEYRDLFEGVSETQTLDFDSPYSLSKGMADQYVCQYNRIFGLRTVVFRQSTVYGYRQFGDEDQGWLAWFIIAALTGRPMTIYGDGKQVRDVIFISDLLDAFDSAIARVDQVAGEVYNLGGGLTNSLSIWYEFGPILEELCGRRIPVRYSAWRPGDQRVCIFDISKARRELGWSPKVDLKTGINELYRWIKENIELFE